MYFLFLAFPQQCWGLTQRCRCPSSSMHHPLQAPKRWAAVLLPWGGGRLGGSLGREPYALLKSNSFLLNMHELSLLKAWQLCQIWVDFDRNCKRHIPETKATSLPAFMPLLQSKGVPRSLKENITRIIIYIFFSFLEVSLLLFYSCKTLLFQPLPQPRSTSLFCGIALAEILRPGADNLAWKHITEGIKPEQRHTHLRTPSPDSSQMWNASPVLIP